MSGNTQDNARVAKDVAGAVGSSVFAAIGLYIFVTSLGMSPMAAMFPRTVGAAMAALAILQVAASLTGRSRVAVEKGGSLRDQAEGLGRRLTLLAVMVVWAFAFPFIGMFVTSLVACIVLMFTGLFGSISRRRLGVYLAAVFVMVVIFYLLMERVLNIPLPRGWLF